MTDLKDMSNEELIMYIHLNDGVSCSVHYKELLSRLEAGQKAIAAMKQIGDLVYNCSCHADTSNAVTKIFMEYEK